jgi:hypothetical protein
MGGTAERHILSAAPNLPGCLGSTGTELRTGCLGESKNVASGTWHRTATFDLYPLRGTDCRGAFHNPGTAHRQPPVLATRTRGPDEWFTRFTDRVYGTQTSGTWHRKRGESKNAASGT